MVFLNKLLLFAIVGAALLLAIAAFALLLAIAFGSSSGSGLFLRDAVAIIPINSEISATRDQFYPVLSSGEIIEKIGEAEKDSAVAAILLDIDSPGGSVVATKNIVARIRQAKKPIVAYINDIGASGAYYVAASTKYVVADEDSLTGSIGVISIVENYSGLLEKIGIDVNVFKEGKNKAMANPFEQMTDEQKQIWQGILSEAFQHFKRDIQEYRTGRLDTARFAEIADGRILSGTQALDAGLIDKLGTKQDAIFKAAELAGIKGEPQTKDFSKKQLSILEAFSGAGYSFGFGFKKAMLSFEQGLKAQ